MKLLAILQRPLCLIIFLVKFHYAKIFCTYWEKKMTEVKLFNHLKKALPKVHWQRVENAVGVGAFDVNGCTQGKEFWLELKIGSPLPLLRFTQYAWGNRRHREGGRLFLLSYNKKEESLSLYKPPFVVEHDDDKLLNTPVSTYTKKKFPIQNKPVVEFSKPWDFEKLLKEYLIK